MIEAAHRTGVAMDVTRKLPVGVGAGPAAGGGDRAVIAEVARVGTYRHVTPLPCGSRPQRTA